MDHRRAFVLLHGAFHGGWCRVRIADILRAAGHRVRDALHLYRLY